MTSDRTPAIAQATLVVRLSVRSSQAEVTAAGRVALASKSDTSEGARSLYMTAGLWSVSRRRSTGSRRATRLHRRRLRASTGRGPMRTVVLALLAVLCSSCDRPREPAAFPTPTSFPLGLDSADACASAEPA